MTQHPLHIKKPGIPYRLSPEKILPLPIIKRLVKNGKEQENAQQQGQKIDFKPVVKLFVFRRNITWLITEIIPNTEDELAFGLCDLGMNCPELGYISLDELLHSNSGILLMPDIFFAPNKTLSQYAEEARRIGYIKA